MHESIDQIESEMYCHICFLGYNATIAHCKYFSEIEYK